MGIIFTGQIPAIFGPVQLEVPTATYSGLSDDSDASVSINPYTNQGPGAGGAGQTTAEIETSRGNDMDQFFDNVSLLLPFDDDLNDRSQFGLSPTQVGTPSLVATNPAPQSGSNSVSLGTGSYLRYTSNGEHFFGSGDFTIEMFVHLDGTTPAIQSVASIWPATDSATWLINWTSSNSKFNFWAGAAPNGGNNPVLSTSSSFGVNAVDEWYHLAVVRSSGTTKFYVDGVEEASSTTSYFISNGSGRNLDIGTQDFAPTRIWNGNIDNVRITKGVARYITTPFDIPSTPFIEQ